MRVLVSGVGGDIGFGVGRILRDWGMAVELHGIDINEDHPGRLLYDRCTVAPRAVEDGYLDWLSDYIRGNDIDVFLPTSEAEIGRIHQCQNPRIFGNLITLISNSLAVTKSLDKFECLRFLAGEGVAVPQNGLVGKCEPAVYPVVMKPRSGQGSKGIKVANTKQEYEGCKMDGYVWQEYLGTADEEFTCPVYRSPNVPARVLVIRRTLHGGVTGKGEVVHEPAIARYVETIASKMELDGVINVQLRMTESGPLLFEVNPRLSSTIVFRDKLGFPDLRWWMADRLGHRVATYIPPPSGSKFYRGSCEYIAMPNSPISRGNYE